ncbi:MAG: tRNA (5-methylaminomethyl-2-thiouridine)(34)-methyltransferase MnmD [Chitinophagales bacterium]|nr:tRNA (5-methylaminomethyl-2-thiouridine)(34)-methyltransferase MnmD [Chitinophagales bacterium]
MHHQKPELFISGDGSHSVMSSVYNTAYHSHHGAFTESKIVFIEAALDYLKANCYTSIDLFEMGFGTGLNAILAHQWAESNQININFHTVEAFPLPLDIVQSLNYGELLGCDDTFQEMHRVSWEAKHRISSYFNLTKWHDKMEDLNPNLKFDAVFYDAFAPATQPELWESLLLAKVFSWMRPGGVLTSFCAQGAFKRSLKEAGFEVERLQGPPGKREMTRAKRPL